MSHATLSPQQTAIRLAMALESAHRDGGAALVGCCAPTVRFEDPLSRVNGHAGVRRVCADTWRHLPDSCIKVRHQALVDQMIYTRWSQVRPTPEGDVVLIEAVSESTLDAQGLVIRHIDYWDSAQSVYRHLPDLGPVLEQVRQRLSSGWEEER